MNDYRQSALHPDPRVKQIIPELEAFLDSAEKNQFLREEKAVHERLEMIDSLGFLVIDPLDELLRRKKPTEQLVRLKLRAEKLKHFLEEIDCALFHRLRALTRQGGSSLLEFKSRVSEYFGLLLSTRSDEPGYDSLDLFINGLLSFHPPSQTDRELEPEMIDYQKTPARIIFEFVEKMDFIKEDVFFDIGAGPGQATILVSLLTGLECRGIELEPAFCGYAADCALALNLSGIRFINVDARKADYSEGTIFFMYTPFRGRLLQDVLDLLHQESLRRKIKLITYGPCTSTVALQSWLDCKTPGDGRLNRPVIFQSI